MPVLLDSRYRLLDYRGLTTCTPNESEVEQVLGIRIDDDGEALERAGRLLLRRTGDAGGAHHARQPRDGAVPAAGSRPIHMPIFGSDEVTDVTGAGDTVIATFGAGARGRRVVLRGGAARQLRRRPRRHEARHRDRFGARAGRRRDERSRHVARKLVAGRAGAGTADES